VAYGIRALSHAPDVAASSNREWASAAQRSALCVEGRGLGLVRECYSCRAQQPTLGQKCNGARTMKTRQGSSAQRVGSDAQLKSGLCRFRHCDEVEDIPDAA
jgi:hypothetical protein